MAGIGVELNRIFEKNTLFSSLVGTTYSFVISVAPMFVVILNILIMGLVLGITKVGYAERELFACTVLYTFIFSLLTTAPFNAVLSRYLSDVIYEERFEDILPCYECGLGLNLVVSNLLAIPFCIREHIVGKVPIYYVFTGYCGYIALVMVFYSMLYLSITKDYKRISLYFFTGMFVAFLTSIIVVKVFHWSITYGMLFAVAVGLILTASLEFALVQHYFKENSQQYKKVLEYLKIYWTLILTNFIYTFGLFIHNFVFWNTDMRMVVVNSFVCNQPYDMASCLAMFTNISASTIFIARIEMKFHERYKKYTEAIIGGRWMDIQNAKSRMFRQISEEIINLIRIQFIISIVIYLLCISLLPRYGFAGMTMRIYPCLAAGYFILFLMYSSIVFLYYFNDVKGSLFTASTFMVITFIGSLFSTRLNEIWFGVGVVMGALFSWSVAYWRLRWLEFHMDEHTFCKGLIIEKVIEPRPEDKVFDRRISDKEEKERCE